jgi:hypothetical protein
MQPTAPDPATALVTRSRPAFAAVMFLLAALCLVPSVRYGMRVFAAPTPPAAETKDDTAPEPPPVVADPNRAEHIIIFLFAALGALVCLGGGLWAAFSTQPINEDDRAALARRALVILGSALGGLAMLLGLVLFYLWFDSATRWLNEGDTTQARWVLIPIAVFLAGAGLTFLAVQPARAEERSNQGLRRLVYGVNLGLTAFLLFAVLLIGNVFASFRIPNQLDTTASGFYTLDPKTREYLATLDTPINAYAVLPEGADRIIDDARRMLISAQEVNPAMFRVRFLSLTLNKDEISRLRKQYPQADLTEFGVLLTAGPDEARSAFLRETDLARVEGGGFGMPRRVTFIGEGSLVREVLFLSDPAGKPVIYFTQRNGELEVIPGRDPTAPRAAPGRTANQLRTVLERGYAEVRVWEPDLTAPKVPDDCTVLVVADPQIPLSKELAGAINAYMTEERDNGKKGKLIVLAGPTPTPDGSGIANTGLEDILAELNIRIENQIILAQPDPDQGLGFTDYIVMVNPNLTDNTIAQTYRNRLLVFSECRPITPTGPAEMAGPVRAEPLMFTYPGQLTWLESAMPSDPRTAFLDLLRNPQLRAAKRLTDRGRVIAVAATEGESNRAVVIGSADFFADPTGRGQTSNVPAEFFANVVDWLRDRPAAAAVAHKTYGEYTPTRTTETFRLYFLPVGLTVLAVVALGAGVWVVRRK